MSEKPEALVLADELDAYHTAAHHKLAAIELRCQHYELRSLHAENERLREALEKIATVNAMDYEYVRWAKAALRREDGK